MIKKEVIHTSNYIISDTELYHYGVLGMKWGVRKASYKSNRNRRLEEKALKYDKKAASKYLKAEKAHAKYDLGESNRAMVKAHKYSKKATNVKRKALSTDDENKQTKLLKKAAKLDYKSSVAARKGNELARTTGYGEKAAKLASKGDKLTANANKARLKIANNKMYAEKMKRKISSLSEDELQNGYQFCKEFLDNYDK